MKLNKSVRASLEGNEKGSLKAIPLVFSGVFLIYLFLSFFLMSIVKSNDAALSNLIAKFHISAAHTLFFRYSIIGCVIVPAILLIEWVCVGWTRSSLNSMMQRREMSGRSDFICFLLTHLRLLRLPQVIFTFGFALISGTMVSEFMSRNFSPGFAGLAVPAVVAFPIYFFLYTFFDYIAHRVDHSRYFWPLHRFHHAAEDFNVLTADRGHPASSLTQSGLKIFPLAAMGVPPDAIIDVGMLIVAINYLNHSRIDWDFGWFGRWVIQSPLHHQMHHSRGLRHPTNLSICPLWDRLGGTWRDVTSSTIIIGTSVPYRHGANVVPDMIRDYRDFLRGLSKGAREHTKRLFPKAGSQMVTSTANPIADEPKIQIDTAVDAGGASLGR